MNKQTIIGLVIIGAILFGFSWYQNNQQKKLLEQRRIEDSIARANMPEPIPEPSLPSFDSLEAAAHAPVAANPAGIPQTDAATETFSVENEVMTLSFSTRGGIIADAVLKDYAKYGGGPLHLWKPGTEVFDVEFFLRRAGRDAQINTRDYVFEHSISHEADHTRVSMKLPVDSLACFELLYTIPRNEYMVALEVRFTGMEGILSNQSSFSIDWANSSLQNEKGFDNENQYTTLAYRYPGVKGVEQFGVAKGNSTKTEDERSRVQWVAFKQHFFTTALISDDAFQGAEMSMTSHDANQGVMKDFSAEMMVPMERDRESYGFRMYLGPNKFSELRQYDISLDRLISLGWMSFGWVSRGVLIPLFDWLSARGLGIGWVIFLMTFIIKLVIAPLTFTSYKSSAKMRVIKPEMDEINARYPDQADAMKKQQAVMELNKRAGINPLAGCIPMLIQFPIIIAMFRFFPSAIELRGQSLWWAEDLSSYDSILDLGFKIPFYGDHVSLFALLMAVSMFFYSWINFKQNPAQGGMPGMKFMMLYMMPVMMLLWFNSFSAGLCFYYTLGNLFNIAQMYIARAFIDEDKIRRAMMAKPVKAKKKSGFMARLEEAQKAQLEAARKQQQATSRKGSKR